MRQGRAKFRSCPKGFYVTASAPRLTENRPLPAGALAYIAEATGTHVWRVLEQTAALAADADAAKALGVSAGSPVLAARERHLDASGQLIAYSETTMRAGSWRSRSYLLTGIR